MTTDEERKTIDRILHKDEKSLILVHKKYHKVIFQFINRKLQNYHESEELAQDVFLDFIESLRDFRYQCSIKTFLFSIAKNKVIDVIRKKKIKKILFSSLPSYFVEGLKTILIDDEIERKELQSKIKRVLESLPNDYQLILRLKYIDGEKVAKIAEKLSLGFKATESLLFRARKAFRKLYENIPI
ncbi:sigma-70 family RNA polymerase sigma factor [Candidatus Roizmanbacteria bacterium]|nr:sigma-70 family RNA polymerase sigma factor [Candidatus Roizmanbacteria bacterium]